MRLAGLIFASLLAAQVARAEEITIDLPTGGSLKALVEVPSSIKSDRAIIYLHDAMIREVGTEKASERGYDLGAHTKFYADSGYLAVSPIRKTPILSDNGDEVIEEGLSAILGAMAVIRNRNGGKSTRVLVAGLGEGALISLWALSQMPDIAAGIIISPAGMAGRWTASKAMSFEKFIDAQAARSIRSPVIIAIGARESLAARGRTDSLARALMSSYRQFRYVKNYPGNRQWFRHPQPRMMGDIDTSLCSWWC